MPTYEYICENCGCELEQFQSITAKPLRDCPECGKKKLKRLLGAGSGIIFKGSGFYKTDYRSESYKKGEKDAKGATETKAKESESKGEGKDTKSDKKVKTETKDKKKTA